MEIITLSLLILICLGLAIFVLIRTPKVNKLHQDIFYMCHDYAIRHKSDKSWKDVYENIPAYNEILFSFKCITINSWLSKEQIKFLKS